MNGQCQHKRTDVEHDDTFDTIMGVEILTRARVLTVCVKCGAVLSDVENATPDVDLAE